MQPHIQAIANEFDSYMQDRAQRLGYRVGMGGPEAGLVSTACVTACARLALVEFSDPQRAVPMPDQDDGGMAALRRRGHVLAWARGAGALVQVNGEIGARTFAEEFFADDGRRSLSLAESRVYLGWLAALALSTDAATAATPASTLPAANSAAPPSALPATAQPSVPDAPSPLALAIRQPAVRTLLLVRTASAASALAWLRRHGAG